MRGANVLELQKLNHDLSYYFISLGSISHRFLCAVSGGPDNVRPQRKSIFDANVP
jgi:hypothetical protein